MIILQVFVFDKTYHLVLRDSVLVHPETVHSAHPRINLFNVYVIGKLIELGAMYLLGPKGSFLAHSESALLVYLRLPFLWCD